MLGLCHVEREFSLVQIGNQGAITERCQSFSHPFDLIIEAPPLLNYDHPRRLVTARGTREITVAILPIRPLESHHLSHARSPFIPNEFAGILFRRIYFIVT